MDDCILKVSIFSPLNVALMLRGRVILWYKNVSDSYGLLLLPKLSLYTVVNSDIGCPGLYELNILYTVHNDIYLI